MGAGLVPLGGGLQGATTPDKALQMGSMVMYVMLVV